MAIFNTVYGGQGFPKDGLLAYWKLEEDLTDYSGNGYNGTQNGTMSYGTVGGYKGVYFNRNGWISTSLSYNSLPISFCIWGYDQDGTNWECMMSNNGGRNNTNCFGLRGTGQNNSTTKTTIVYGGGEWQDSAVPINEWHFYCVTIVSGTTKFYKDGNLITTNSVGTTGSNVGNWKIANFTSAERKGYLRQGAVYNRVLSADEIALYYNKTK